MKGIAEETGKIPKALRDMPSLDPQEEFYYEAFWKLGMARSSSGFGLNPIPVSEVKALADHYQLRNLEDRDRLLTYVQSLDVTYLELLRTKQREAEAAKQKEALEGGNSPTGHRNPRGSGRRR